MEKIGFGGGCHWCTEAIFRCLNGVGRVEQGWIAPAGDLQSFSEAVVVHFDPAIITLEILIAIHLHTHSCTARHSMRAKYRSAVYTFTDEHANSAAETINTLQTDFNKPIITGILPFGNFRLNDETYLDYYYKNPDKPFCKTYIAPKLQQLREIFSKVIKSA